MFDIDQLVADCRAALAERTPRQAIKEVLQRAVADPRQVEEALPPRRAEIATIHLSDELTLLNVVWAPKMTLYPHDHRMWAAIAIYGGQEDNTFYRRAEGGLVLSGGKELRQREVALLGDDTIHSVHNPCSEFTAAIHVYGGDFFAQSRSEWDPETLTERPYDAARTMAFFEAANDPTPRAAP